MSSWNGRCIDVRNFDYSEGRQLIAWDCNGGDNQKFDYVDGTFQSQNGLCLSVAGGSTMRGAAIQLAACSTDASQQFIVTDSNQIQNPNSNKCITIKSWKNKNGAKLVSWTCKTSKNANQLWDLG
ncbi:ricin-type beta-trefoil lectin domain protein [Salinibacterium sp.]|uniref:ricin-type beta-trefoil lectin domain protein n=1 Tax=Salinibacterium sp. TaxID=1915057 RepID=UPI00286C58C9|nr:ricin-type beta-trefoil lectin domain protein [Salinibacterium sp.]